MDSELELELKNVKKDLNSESGSSTGIITAQFLMRNSVAKAQNFRLTDVLFRHGGTSEHDAREGNGHADWDGRESSWEARLELLTRIELARMD